MQFKELSAGLPAAAAGVLRPASGYPADPAPSELLRVFTRRMASHGEWTSSAMMRCDRRYALRQLAAAHCTDDDTLRSMAMALFREFDNPAPWHLRSMNP
ncbi:MAG: hypothetical protein V4731_10910 [Pseudomonadota bacterium]